MATIETIPAVRRLIVELQARGVSLRSALDAYRADGGRMRTEDFSTLWRDEQRKRERSAA